MKRKKLLLILMLLIGLIPYITVEASESYPSIQLRIQRIRKVDEIENVFEGQADWYYYVQVYDGNNWITETGSYDGADDLLVGEDYFYEVTITEVPVVISLFETDTISSRDLADISSYSGGGADDWTDSSTRGTQLRFTYNIKTNKLYGDEILEESGYHKTSGEYDGSIYSDENDAELYFNCWNNYDPPVAKAGSDRTVDLGEKVNFDASNSYATGASIVKYEWDFDNDGVIDSQGERTSYTFVTSGMYTVRLVVTDSLNQQDVDTCYVYVEQLNPEASFTYAPDTQPTMEDEIHFYDTSTDEDGTITAWNWNFGDGSSSTLKDPIHQYNDKGTYTVRLTVTDNDGLTDTYTKNMKIYNLPPQADFSFSPTTTKVGAEITFNSECNDPEGKPMSYTWTFDDGFTSSSKNPVHGFTSPGTRRVTLTVTDDEGAQDQTSKTINIIPNQKPNADFNFEPKTQSVDKEVSFEDNSNDPDGHLTEYYWDFDDGSTSEQKNPTHTYTEEGEYVVTLVVTDDNGETDSSSKTITIKKPVDILIIAGLGGAAVLGVGYYLMKRMGN